MFEADFSAVAAHKAAAAARGAKLSYTAYIVKAAAEAMAAQTRAYDDLFRFKIDFVRRRALPLGIAS